MKVSLMARTGLSPIKPITPAIRSKASSNRYISYDSGQYLDGMGTVSGV